MNDINWDEPINQKILEHCHKCGEFIVTDQKDELSLFMYDHYGKDGIRKCLYPDDELEAIHIVVGEAPMGAMCYYDFCGKPAKWHIFVEPGTFACDDHAPGDYSEDIN